MNPGLSGGQEILVRIAGRSTREDRCRLREKQRREISPAFRPAFRPGITMRVVPAKCALLAVPILCPGPTVNGRFLPFPTDIPKV
jgi:hypothetical protein